MLDSARRIALTLLLTAVAPAALAEQTQTLESGLDAKERRLFYHAPLGSELVPLAWIEALENAAADGADNGKPFLETVARYGLLADPGNRHGLPIGMTAAESDHPSFKDRIMVGFTCAACHVGELRYQGQVVRIDGAPNLLRIELFIQHLAESLGATLKSKKKVFAFVKRMRDHTSYGTRMAENTPDSHKLFGEHDSLDSLLKGDPKLARALNEAQAEVARVEASALGHGGDAAKKNKQGWLARLREKVGTNAAVVGTYFDVFKLLKSRLAFLIKMRKVGGYMPTTDPGPGRNDDWTLGRNVVFKEADWLAAQASVSYPDLWGYNDAKWLTWNGATTSGMERGIATVIGMFAQFDQKKHTSSVSIRGLAVADKLALQIQPPRWPAKIFGPIDGEKAKRGEQIYRQQCASCHDKPGFTDLHEIGTDPLHALGYVTPLNDGRPFPAAFSADMTKYKASAYKAQKVSPDVIAKVEAAAPDVWKSVYRYVSRPLAGAWATAPYLHNGSVPTIHDLLLPPAQRPRSFPVGHRDFDPVKLGHTTDPKVVVWTFDVGEPGNDNGGHLYGTDLDEGDRMALLEYLKSL
ncbi:MAG: cytochrome c [Alphaproteobacteria bacterium]|jgi:cytochrome c1|nr:cytochrome c [Alphaproteobacteria bacterium]